MDTRLPLPVNPQTWPETPGCYIFRDTEGQVLFVGMARSLRRRLSEMLIESQPLSEAPLSEAPLPESPLPGRLRYLEVRPQMLKRLHSIELILLENEADCVLLVNHLIGQHRPIFNLATFLEPYGTSYIVQTGEPWPRFIAAGRSRVAKQALPGKAEATFGPYTSPTRGVLLECINETLGLRTCVRLPAQACLDYPRGRCAGPCEGHISAEDYAGRVAQAARLLAQPLELANYMEGQMQAAAEAMEFERAGRLRDQSRRLRAALDQQPVETVVDHDQDVVYVAQGWALVLHLRGGRLVGVEDVVAPEVVAPEASAGPEEFILRQYGQACPPELIIQPVPADPEGLSAKLAEVSGCPVRVRAPGSPREIELMRAAQANHAYRVHGTIPNKLPHRKGKR